MTTKTRKLSGKKTAQKTTKKYSKPTVDATPHPDPCADGHKWDTDAEGIEHCTVCLADRTVIEKPGKKQVARATTAKPAKAEENSEGKLSALDAAAKVLSESAEPLNAKQTIEAMATKGLWTSPGDATPHATLYSAILREIQVKGAKSRFTKTERGKFATNG